MKITDSQKKEVARYIKKWRSILFLHQWNFDISYHDDMSDGGLRITMQPEYKNALIEINVVNFFKRPKYEREECIVHELCHCIVQPLVHIACEGAMGRQVSQSEIDWFKEDVTQHIARAIFYYK